MNNPDNASVEKHEFENRETDKMRRKHYTEIKNRDKVMFWKI